MYTFTVILTVLLLNYVSAQDAREILTKSFEAALKIESGKYEMDFFWKPLSGNKPYKTVINTEFKKVEENEYEFLINYKEGNYNSIFTGEELISINYKDSTAIIFSSELHGDFISDRLRSLRLFSPILKPSKFYSNALTDSAIVTFVSDTANTFLIKIDFPPENDQEQGFNIFNYYQLVWINQNTFLPERFDQSVNVIMNNDSMLQFYSFKLDNYNYSNKLNNFTVENIPEYFLIQDYIPEEFKPLLSNGTMASGFQLPDMSGNTKSLEDYRGDLVLIDFFYRACFGCRKALPFLNDLHQKYQSKGLSIIGINPIDKDVDELKKFLTKHTVNYTVLLSEKAFPLSYNVMAYPTIYLVDKNGRIIFSKAGYQEEMEKEIEEIILKNL
ncbi:MAG: peroxiredoxin family protein [Bacteroidia bacterium]